MSEPIWDLFFSAMHLEERQPIQPFSEEEEEDTIREIDSRFDDTDEWEGDSEWLDQLND